MEKQGNVREKTFAELVRTLYRERRSGTLSMNGGERDIFFKNGAIVFSVSRDPANRLGEFLIRKQLITREQLEEALRQVRHGQRLGQVLVALSYLTSDQLLRAASEQILSNIYPVFAWKEGEYVFHPDAPPVDEDLELNFSTANIIMEGVRRIEDDQFIQERLGRTDRIIVLAADPMLRFQSVRLKTMEAFILSRIDGLLTIDQVCSITPMPEGHIFKCIYGLLSAGILELEDEASRKEKEKGETVEDNIAGFFSDLAGVEEQAQKTARIREEREVSAEGQQEQEALSAFHEKMSQMNYFEILGVAVEADDREIKKAYHQLAKKYHPDRYHAAGRPDVRQILERIFVKVNEAYDTLSDKEKRRYYSRTVPGRPETAPEQKGETAEPVRGVDRDRMAQDCFGQGKKFFDEGDYYSAIRAFRSAVEYAPGKTRYRIHLGIGLSMNPKWRKEAEETFMRVIEMEPFNAEAYAQLGKLYQRGHLLKRAEKSFLEALKLDRANATALEGLAQIRESAKGGFVDSFKSIFREKKKK
jgi:curved DNA-binding protein CbpA